MFYYVYIVSCEDDSFYTGYTKNVESRMKLHLGSKGAKYTQIHKPRELVYVEKMYSRIDAIRRERQIKRLSRRKKLELIKSFKIKY